MMATADVIWLRSASGPHLHAVNADAIVPRGTFTMPTICRPSAVLHLLPPGRGTDIGIARCKGCLNRLLIPAGGANMTPRADPPPQMATVDG